jgi:hypothetical protein
MGIQASLQRPRPGHFGLALPSFRHVTQPKNRSGWPGLAWPSPDHRQSLPPTHQTMLPTNSERTSSCLPPVLPHPEIVALRNCNSECALTFSPRIVSWWCSPTKRSLAPWSMDDVTMPHTSLSLSLTISLSPRVGIPMACHAKVGGLPTRRACLRIPRWQRVVLVGQMGWGGPQKLFSCRATSQPLC